ncbi:MAG: tetratricopeptide repeat protein [Anaerolineales bacterium]|nr:tetratricopeptide repeat protein [Anaerolineales bacterium]
MITFDRQQLRTHLDQQLTANSLRVLCFRLNVDYDNLEGGNKNSRIVSLISYLDSRGRLYELMALVEADALPQPGEQLALSFPVVFQLPLANAHFTGRELLLARLAVGEGAMAITQAIAGMGGVGKTQLALAYAHQRRERFDLIAWLNGSEAAVLDGELRRLGLLLRLPLPLNDALAGRQMVLSWLNGTDKRWLLVYDNVDSLSAAELRPFLPTAANHSGCQLLLTSRSPHWVSLAQVVNVNVFTPEEAVAFLAQRLGADAPGLVELAAELGYLPLALAQAAAYMETRGVEAAAYRRLFQTRRQALWELEEAPDDYHATVATTWTIGFEQVQGVPGAADLLALCSFLAGDGIPLPLLLLSFAEVDRLQKSPFQRLLKIFGIGKKSPLLLLQDEIVLAEAVGALRWYALLEGNGDRVQMHRLLQTVYRDQMGTEAEAAWLETAMGLLRAAWPFDPNDMASWEASRELLPQLLAVVEAANAAENETEAAAVLNSRTDFYISYFGDLATARPYSERALGIREKALGSEHADTAQSLNNLGALLDSMGNLAEARPYYERALGINEKALGPEHPDTASSLNNLAWLLYDEGNIEEAARLMRRVVVILEKTIPNHSNTQTARRSLAAIEDALRRGG